MAEPGSVPVLAASFKIFQSKKPFEQPTKHWLLSFPKEGLSSGVNVQSAQGYSYEKRD